jgi:acetyl-CoA acyltransferase
MIVTNKFVRVSRLAQVQTRAASKRSLNGPRLSCLRNVVLVDAVRTPFLMSGTDYKKLMAVDLARETLKALAERTKLDKSLVQYSIMGTVLQEFRTSNVGHEALLGAGYPDRIPAHTVTQACTSSNVALTDLTTKIAQGEIDVAVAAGVETMSDMPVRAYRPMREFLLGFGRAKTWNDRLALYSKVPKLFAYEPPLFAEFTSGEVMGQNCDRLCTWFGVSRKEQDQFALRSHTFAFEATKKGLLSDKFEFKVPGGKPVVIDNGIRPSSMEKLGSLGPAFTKKTGTVTAANSSFLTDGASAALVMSEEKALQLGYKPKAYLRDSIYVAQDPKDQLLLGPSYSLPRLMDRNKLTWNDIDVVEIHEAFAGQILSNMKALDSDEWARERQNRSAKLGPPPFEKLNLWGGSVSLGHPFAATGIRLAITAANRLIHEDKQIAVIAACAAGAIGHAAIIERYPN